MIAAEKVPNNGVSRSGSTPTPSEPSPNPVVWTVNASEDPSDLRFSGSRRWRLADVIVISGPVRNSRGSPVVPRQAYSELPPMLAPHSTAVTIGAVASGAPSHWTSGSGATSIEDSSSPTVN
ncbi:hypothetical protein [Amycolatopsis sp. NPDC059020]|uniref:hypothetical protein n=1 Tax=Amycolatopsis sp. NPDC059020 TaxID=3346703 RepID=UPI00366C7EF8